MGPTAGLDFSVTRKLSLLNTKLQCQKFVLMKRRETGVAAADGVFWSIALRVERTETPATAGHTQQRGATSQKQPLACGETVTRGCEHRFT
jgi:hypothetical protein